MTLSRRHFLKVLGAGGAGMAAAQMPLMRAFAATPAASDEFFIFIHASGGWDVTLWADPRNQLAGIVEPASTDNTDISALTHWQGTTLQGSTQTFQILQPAGSNLMFGPGIGSLIDNYDRLCVFNGLAMNTVSHPDGTAFSATGRHLAGGHAVASSVDTMVANEVGTTQLFPAVSVNFPSYFVGDGLDRRAVPLRIGSIGTIAKCLTRSTLYDTASDRDSVTAMLSEEAQELAGIANQPDVLNGFKVQYDSLRQMLGGSLSAVFSQSALQAAHPEFNYRARFQSAAAVNAAFAVEAMKRNVVRCVAFTGASFDTHNTNYRFQAQTQQELFDLIAAFLKTLDATPHPTRTTDKLSDHTHILVVSDFCRTPQINTSGGRDHYPNNSALVISPRFKGNYSFGSTDSDQVLPANVGSFSDGPRPVAPPDLLATFVGAFGIDPRKYLRDGEVVKDVLKS
jgi:uncharacterized protein (DUF1501 family)